MVIFPIDKDWNIVFRYGDWVFIQAFRYTSCVYEGDIAMLGILQIWYCYQIKNI